MNRIVDINPEVLSPLVWLFGKYRDLSARQINIYIYIRDEKFTRPSIRSNRSIGSRAG